MINEAASKIKEGTDESMGHSGPDPRERAALKVYGRVKLPL